MNTLSDEQVREVLQRNGRTGGVEWAKRQAVKGWDEVTKRLHEGRKKARLQKKKQEKTQKRIDTP